MYRHNFTNMTKQCHLFLCITVCFIIILFFSMSELLQENTLQQIHVLFRHGSRNPEKSYLYPNDPHINDTWYPEGLGQLTKDGKMLVYKIGRHLRKTYDNFLGTVYTPDAIEAISTEYDRTKMSLQLVLAGLFPPIGSQVWNDMLPWQPIPYNIVSIKSDFMRFALFHHPQYAEMFKNLENLDHVQHFYKTNSELIQYISKCTGIKDIFDIFNLTALYDTLITEEETGRKLPEWTQNVNPEFWNQVIYLFYELQLYNEEMKKITSGNLLQKIIKEMQAKKEGTLTPKDRKIFLYSGHEFTIAYILSAFNLFEIHMPTYAAYVILELHLINDVYGIKILYQDYKQKNPKYLTIKGCDIFCPFDKVLTFTEAILPNKTI